MNETESVEEQECSTSLADLLTEACHIKDHKVLHLNYKGLVQIPSQLTDGHHDYQHVQNIYAKRNLITSLPPDIHRLCGLKILYLHSNNLASLPEELSELKCLESLDVSENCFTTFPDVVCRCTSLKFLHMSINQLSSIPPEIGHLKQLTQLNLMSNNLTTIPQEIGQCSNLQTLHLNSNKLKTLPRQITLLQNLDELSVTGNRLTVLPLMLGWLSCEVYADSNPSLCSIPFTLYSRPVGVSRCGNVQPPEERCIRVGALCGVPPPEIQVWYDETTTKDQPSTLLELAYNAVHKHKDVLDICSLPKLLADQVRVPTAYCNAPSCGGTPIFTEAYVHLLQIPWVQDFAFAGNGDVCLMGVCCSLSCLGVFKRHPIPT